MKHLKKWISYLLALAMTLSMVPVTAFAEEATSGTCGENVTWNFDKATGTLTISGSGEMEDYPHYMFDNFIFAPWHAFQKTITAIVIEPGVASIGENAFWCCFNLASVTIPDSVTTIGIGAFDGCESLISVTIPDSINTIGEDTFRNCLSLTNISIPDSINTIGEGAFRNCLSLTNISIPDSVTTIGAFAFSYCNSLTDISIPNSINTINDGMFSECYNLVSITIPTSVTTIGEGAFLWCDKLSDVYYGGTEQQWSAIKFGPDNSSLIDAEIHYNSAMPDNDEPKGNRSVYVRYFTSWDAESQTAYFDGDTITGSRVTDKTDTSFLKDLDSLVGQYVLVETEARNDNMIVPDTLLSIKAVETGVGTVTAANQDNSTITVNGKEYVVTKSIIIEDEDGGDPTDLFNVCSYIDDFILYHIYDGKIVDLESLEETESTLIAWDTETRMLTFGINTSQHSQPCPLSHLADEETLSFLGESSREERPVVYYADRNTGAVYRVEERIEYKPERPRIEFKSEINGWSFANIDRSFAADPVNRANEYYIPESRYDEVFGEAYLDSGIGNFSTDWNGNCSGMSATAILFFLGSLDWDDYAEKFSETYADPNDFYQAIHRINWSTTYFPAIGDTCDLTRLIEAYQLYLKYEPANIKIDLTGIYFADEPVIGTWCGEDEEGNRISIKAKFEEHVSQTEGGTYIASKLTEFQNAYANNIPLYVVLVGEGFDHAIVSRTDKEPEEMGDGWWRVYVYDPNKPYVDESIIDEIRNNSFLYDLADGCNSLVDNGGDVYLELNPELNQWRYCTGVNSGAEEKYIGSSPAGEVLTHEAFGTEVDGTSFYTSRPDVFVTLDLSILLPEDFLYPTTRTWIPEDALVVELERNTSCSIFTSTGELAAIVDNGQAFILSGDGSFTPYVGQSLDGGSAGGRILLPEGTYSLHYSSGAIRFLGNDNVISFSADGAAQLSVDIASNSIQATTQENGTVSIKCANVFSADECSYVETTGTLAAGESFSISYSDENEVEASTDSENGAFPLYEKDADEEEPVPSDIITADSDRLFGDANGDALVDYLDAMLVLRHAVKLITLSEDVAARCDVDASGGIDYLDAMLILRRAVKLIDKFPVEAK